MIIQKEIIYPYFLDCCMYATDNFWENIFEDLAYGITPYGTYISKNFFCCSYKKKEFSYKIENKDPKELYNDIYELLTIKLGLYSNKEKAKKKFDFESHEDDIKILKNNWSNIRKKSTKDILIEKYVIDMKYKHNLSISQSKYLLSLIIIALMFKTINIKDIKYENGKILNIEGIDFNNNDIIFKRNLFNLEPIITPQFVEYKKFMFDNWEKLLKDLRKVQQL
jgi:hypothetical protein